MLSRFEVVATAAALVCGLLGALWLAVPQLPLAIFQIDSGQGALLVGQRGGALFAGLAVVFAGARQAPPSAFRHALAKGFMVSCVLLAALGMVGLDEPRRDLEQRRLARAVAADEADALPGRDRDLGGFEQGLSAEGERDVAQMQQGGHDPSCVRPAG